jgi:3',5'-cyclic AMP phosphodiesterase CpdA
MTARFTLAQVSDLHLGPLPWLGVRDWNVKRALGVANWLRKRQFLHTRAAFEAILAAVHAASPDHIAVTGDLVNVGLPAEHARALDTLRQIGPPEKVSVVPGNHDIYCRLWSDPGVARWAPHAMSDGIAGDMTFPYVRRRGSVVLVGVNSAVPTPPGIAQGEVGPAQRQALEQILAKTGAAGLFRVVMIHHPPLAGKAPPQRALRDTAAVTDVLANAGVELVIHGHNHLDEWTEIETRSGLAVVHGAFAGARAGSPRRALRNRRDDGWLYDRADAARAFSRRALGGNRRGAADRAPPGCGRPRPLTAHACPAQFAIAVGGGFAHKFAKPDQACPTTYYSDRPTLIGPP